MTAFIKIDKNYPIGSILLWNSSERLKASRNIGGLILPDREPEYPVNYVLDGQQRLSSIYAVFCADREFAPAEGEYAAESNVFDIAFRFDDQAFIPRTNIENDRPTIVLSSLLDTQLFFEAIEPLSSEHRAEARSLNSLINNYEIPVVTISRREKDEVGVIFERINSTGTRLTALDLLIAWTWSEDFHLQDSLRDLSDILDLKGFASLPDKVILQCLGGILADDARTKTILALDPIKVRDLFDSVGAAMAAAIDFLSTEFKIQSLELLPHLQQVVPLSYFFSKVNTPTGVQVETLKKWFWKTSFSRRYSAQTDDKINSDISFMRNLASGSDAKISSYSSELSADILVNLKFTKSHPYTRALLLLLAQRAPLDLTNGSAVDLGESLSSFNRKEYHHIFPRAFLRSRGGAGGQGQFSLQLLLPPRWVKQKNIQ